MEAESGRTQPAADLRGRLMPMPDASLDSEVAAGHRWDIVLGGDGETPFFLD